MNMKKSIQFSSKSTISVLPSERRGKNNRIFVDNATANRRHSIGNIENDIEVYSIEDLTATDLTSL